MWTALRYLRIFIRLSGWIGVLILWGGLASFTTGLDLSSAASAIGTEGKLANVIILEKELLEGSGSGRLKASTGYYLTFVLVTPEGEAEFNEKVGRNLFHRVEVGQSVPITYLPGNLAMHEFAENGLKKKSMGALIGGTALTLLGIGLMLYYLRRLYFAAYILKHGERRVGYIGDKRMSFFMSRLRIIVIEDRKVIDDKWSFWRFPFPHIGRHRKDKIDVMYDPKGKGKSHWCGDLK